MGKRQGGLTRDVEKLQPLLNEDKSSVYALRSSNRPVRLSIAVLFSEGSDAITPLISF